MNVLVIPDVHLKPHMFERASELMEKNIADKAVCLMDIADDFQQQYNLDLYEQTYDAAIRFAKDFPQTLWCYGNHDLSYPWQQMESGYSPIASRMVCEKLRNLEKAVPDGQIAYLHRIDNVIFCHGGLSDVFVQNYVPVDAWEDPNRVLEIINGFGKGRMWKYWSPIWYRPQGYAEKELYKETEFLHVVGHTPIKQITKEGNLLSCDVFSTYADRTPLGNCEYLLLDTETWEYKGVPLQDVNGPQSF